ncbi:hypothetical protein CHCC20335_3710 [Bacillus paralicheniformis]|nr:hypothetical protein CHCC20335_3710 [Bacillus paralicheniformis]
MTAKENKYFAFYETVVYFDHRIKDQVKMVPKRKWKRFLGR